MWWICEGFQTHLVMVEYLQLEDGEIWFKLVQCNLNLKARPMSLPLLLGAWAFSYFLENQDDPD